MRLLGKVAVITGAASGMRLWNRPIGRLRRAALPAQREIGTGDDVGESLGVNPPAALGTSGGRE